MTHAEGNVLYDRIDDPPHALPYEILTPSAHPDLETRREENQQEAERFGAILLRRQDGAGMAATPLREEWVLALVMLWLCQVVLKPLSYLPFGFLPDTDEFRALVEGCFLPELRHKFGQIARLTAKGLRAEVGSASRLVNAVFRSRAFLLRARGGFNLGAFFQAGGKLVVEGGDALEDVTRVVIGMLVLKIKDFARRRPAPWPRIRVRLDEANSAGLVGTPELKGIAQTRKYGLFWDFLSQDLSFPGGHEAVLNNCKRHEWMGLKSYELARKAAADILANLPPDERSRPERMEQLTNDVMTMAPGWRWVVEGGRAWREYVPMLENPWPDWPGLREAKLREKLARTFARPEYRPCEPTNSATSSTPATPPPTSSGDDSSPARRLRRGESS